VKAVVYTQYGSPDVLQLKEVEKPVPKDGEILVKIYAASANPLDWHLMRASPFFVRLEGGLRKPKDPRLGADLAGRVEAVGNNVTQFEVGDEVFGAWTGSFAEYTAVPENRVALKPTKSSFEEAAAIPVAAITALQGLRDKGQIHSGQKVGLMGIANMNQKDLVYMKELLEAGKVVPVIEKRYPLGETASALRYLEAGHARGKVVITVAQNHNTSR